MLASTVQFSTYGRAHLSHDHPPRHTRRYKPHRWSAPPHTRPTPECINRGTRRNNAQQAPVPSGPNSVPQPAPQTTPFHSPTEIEAVLSESADNRPTGQCSTLEHHRKTFASEMGLNAIPRRDPRQMLLRKEVIQPHLPVRLPCYDFVPIASPTFDGSLHKGWATGFGCCRLS